MNPQQFAIDIDIYSRSILVCINDSNEEIKRVLLESGIDEKKATEVSEYWDYQVGAFTHVFKNRNCFIRFKRDEVDPVFHNQVAHEIAHCAFAILDHVGIKLGSKSEEAYTYLIGYITEQFYINLQNN